MKYTTSFAFMIFISVTSSVLASNYDDNIMPYALSPYTTKNYPKTVAEFGPRLKEIEGYRRTVAEMALDSGKCDDVMSVELASESSINKLVFWADCLNGHRVYLSEADIKAQATVRTQQEKAWSEPAAIAACKKSVIEMAALPNKVKFHSILGTRFYKADLTHNAIVKIDFDATNMYGVKETFTATCNFEPGKTGTVDIDFAKKY